MIDTVEHKDTLLSNERKCIVTGEIRDRDEMYRFIIDPDNQILPDLAAKLPGRGFWVSANQSSLKLAIEKNLFEKSAKKDALLPLRTLYVVLTIRPIICLLKTCRIR